MNALLDKAMKAVARLSDAEQEAIARELLDRLREPNDESIDAMRRLDAGEGERYSGPASDAFDAMKRSVGPRRK